MLAQDHVIGLIYVQSRKVEDTADIEVQHLLRRPVWRRLEWSSPCRAGIADQNVELVVSLLDLLDQSLNVFGVCDVGSNSDGFARNTELVELVYGLVDTLEAFVLSRRNKDLFCTSEEECSGSVKTETS